MEEEVVLLSSWESPFGMRVQIALAEKGIKYGYKEEDLLSNKTNLLLQLNPVHKKVPVLIHNGKPICESMIVVQYIDEVWKDKSPLLLPSDPYQRSQARFWADFVDSTVYGHGSKVLFSKGEEKEGGKKGLLESIKLLEEELGNKPYFDGDNFGFVDIALVPAYSWVKAFETCGNFSIEAECPKFIAWAERCVQHKVSVSKTLPDQHKVRNFLLQLRKKLGVD
ncbi:Glutathione S-transferase-like protein [Quillaja saponaria]|uniref:glutathione transferase n=1 Tax=Quillaja saponaria TaxID=32244 RepID=A0AAD7PB16_QUISA|nr:Glutathione S-transferase-like protein [Quillaja saponaria]